MVIPQPSWAHVDMLDQHPMLYALKKLTQITKAFLLKVMELIQDASWLKKAQITMMQHA